MVKKYLKKLACFMLLATVLFTTSVSAYADQGKVIDKPEINNMFNSAVSQYHKNLASGNVKADEIKYVTVTNKSSGKKYLIKAFKYNNGNEKKDKDTYLETYVISTDKEFVQPATQDSISAITPLTTWTNSAYNEDWDDSISVKAYITLNYNRTPGTNNYLLVNVTGGWYVSDQTVSVNNRQVIMACFTPSTYYSQYITKTPYSNTFNYDTGFTKYVSSSDAGDVLGAAISATLIHASSDWDFTFPFTLFNNGSTYWDFSS